MEKKYLEGISKEASNLLEVYKAAVKSPHDPSNMCPAFGDYLLTKLRSIRDAANKALGE